MNKIQIESNLDLIMDFADNIPVDVIAAAEAAGVRVSLGDLPDGVSGKIQRDGAGRYFIVANKNEPPVRQRFTIAHELGHFIYHKSLIGDGVSDTPAYRAPDQTVYDQTPLEPHHEKQANAFAANLLMPRDAIRRYQEGNPDRGVADMARAFNVSEDAMRIRIGMPTRRQEMAERYPDL
ncbi:MAG: ImmA/IrrE family metallo-endopeptidase [Hyphomicrobiales bacterium]